MKPILIVQGAQYGSEAKGAIAGYLCKSRKVDVAVRTGATNAGHTVYYDVPGAVPPHQKTAAIKLQQLPVGFVNPDTKLVIGAGAIVDPEILQREVQLLSHLTGTDIRDRLMVDRRAALHAPTHAARSKASGRHHAIGATGKGCSEALVDRIRNRGQDGYFLFGDSPYSKDYDTCDTEIYLNDRFDEGAQLLLEGTQGQLLDLYLGPYPYTTHKQTGPAQWMLEAGLSPSLPTEIVMVARTFPIRVAGNSGPLPQEISWSGLARSINFNRAGHGLPPIVNEDTIKQFEQAVRDAAVYMNLPHGSNGLDQHTWTDKQRVDYQEALSELHKFALDSLPAPVVADLSKLFEMTTVTRKLRRVAELSLPTLAASARQMRPAWIALTFANYLWPQHWYQVPGILSREQTRQVSEIEAACKAPVYLMTFGPEDRHVVTTKGIVTGEVK